MSTPFDTSRRKIERAEKHISDLDRLFTNLALSDFYDLVIDTNSETGENGLSIHYDHSKIPLTDSALILGDALHNLRSALDIAYYRIVAEGTATDWTRFPICDSRESLEATLNSALKQKQITTKVSDIILEIIKAYRSGNPFLWGLHDLNIIDKHQLLIPVLELVILDDVCLEDSEGKKVFSGLVFFYRDIKTRLHKAGMRDDTKIKSKGHATVKVLLPEGSGFDRQEVTPSLYRIAEEVTRTLDCLETIT